MHRIAASAALAWAAAVASAQEFPTKPIRIVASEPGGGQDFIARLLAQGIAAPLGQSVIVENRPGADSTIATELGAKAAPDGHTLITVTNAHVITPFQRKLPYDPVKSFTPIAQIGIGPSVIAVTPSLPVNSVRQLINMAKARPGQLHYASAGIGGVNHFAGELFKLATQTDIVHVPYKGGGQMVIAVISGEGQVMFSPVSTAVPHGKTGKLRLLGVSSAARIASLPDVPTIAETIKGYEYGGWQGLLAPAGTPVDIINRLHAGVLKVIATPEFRDYAAGEGSDIVGSTPDWFAQFLKSEVGKNATLVKAAGIKPE